MLEQDDLLIKPWAQQAHGRQHTRGVYALTGNELLGFAEMHSAEGRWHSWLWGPSLHVRESEDASLLMTIGRTFRWSRSWKVHDADERLVGTIRPRPLINSQGQTIAVLEKGAGDRPSRFLGPEKQELAEIERRADGSIVLCFATRQEKNPFTRMILLGAVLIMP